MSRLTACLIVRNEEQLLPDCLASLVPWVDEICVVDTGSSDDTAAIAERHGARVEHVPWGDDFAAARNACLELSSGDWILSIDADERLRADSGEALRRAISVPAAQAWLVQVENHRSRGASAPVDIPRLFRNRPEIRFARRVHETIMDSLIALGVERLDRCGVVLDHLGYTDAVMHTRDKYERNLRLLERVVEANPDDLFARYKLARTLRDPGRRFQALQEAVAREKLLDAEQRDALPFLPLLHDAWARQLTERGELNRALQAVSNATRRFPTAPELIWRRGDLARRTGDLETAATWLKRSLAPRPAPPYGSDPAVTTVRPCRGLGEVALAAGEGIEALHWARRGLSFDADDVGTRCLEVRALISTGDLVGALRGLSEVLSRHAEDPEVRLLAGELASLQGEPEAARGLWTAGASSATDAGHACRAHLAILALAGGRPTEAEALVDGLALRDLDCAAAALVVRVARGLPFERDHAFRAQRLLHRSVGWLRELIRQGAEDALSGFASHARSYNRIIPGIEVVLEG